jgi:hypothetical protein
MTFFEKFTTELKDKWLHYYKVNRSWLNLHLQVTSVPTPDGGRRPPSYFILGVTNALEPKLAQLMLPFSQLNPDAESLIQVLGLDFDPEIALGLREPGEALPAEVPPAMAEEGGEVESELAEAAPTETIAAAGLEVDEEAGEEDFGDLDEEDEDIEAFDEDLSDEGDEAAFGGLEEDTDLGDLDEEDEDIEAFDEDLEEEGDEAAFGGLEEESDEADLGDLEGEDEAGAFGEDLSEGFGDEDSEDTDLGAFGEEESDELEEVSFDEGDEDPFSSESEDVWGKEEAEEDSLEQLDENDETSEEDDDDEEIDDLLSDLQ